MSQYWTAFATGSALTAALVSILLVVVGGDC